MWLPQVLAGLHFLHRRCRIIHADIKPENVLLCIRDKGLQRLLCDATDCGQRTDLRLQATGELWRFSTRKEAEEGAVRSEMERWVQFTAPATPVQNSTGS